MLTCTTCDFAAKRVPIQNHFKCSKESAEEESKESPQKTKSQFLSKEAMINSIRFSKLSPIPYKNLEERDYITNILDFPDELIIASKSEQELRKFTI